MHGKRLVLNCSIRHPLSSADAEPIFTEIKPFNMTKFKSVIDKPDLVVIYSHFDSFIYLSGKCENLDRQFAMRPYETGSKGSDCSQIQMTALQAIVARDRDLYYTIIETTLFNTINPHRSKNPDAECPVCYTSLFDNPKLCVMTHVCKHLFCKPCLSSWLSSGKDRTCPYCRSEID